MRLAIQLYSLRSLERSLPDLLALVADSPFEGVEFAGLDSGLGTGVVADQLAATGLEPVAAHVPIEDLEDDPTAVAEQYRDLDCDYLVVPWLEPAVFEERERLSTAIDRLRSVAGELEGTDTRLAYHNHDQEFTTLPAAGDREPTDAFEPFVAGLAEAGIGLELDVGWAVAADRDPIAILERHGDLIDLVHLKDVDGDRPCALGAGDVPLEATVEAAREAEVSWLVYEHDDPNDPAMALERDGERATTLLAGAGDK